MFNNNKNKKGAGNMKSSKKNGNSRAQNVSSVNMVSEGTEIIGTLKTTNDIRIAGSVDGEAKVNGKIIIASSGHLDGNIDSEDADIAGRVEGEVHVSDKLTLRQTAVVEGDLYAQSLVVEEGATFNGACHMRDYATKNKRAEEKKNAVESEQNKQSVSA
jgi:cytoskeletal protein CcmA (bactofilin family)